MAWHIFCCRERILELYYKGLRNSYLYRPGKYPGISDDDGRGNQGQGANWPIRAWLHQSRASQDSLDPDNGVVELRVNRL